MHHGLQAKEGHRGNEGPNQYWLSQACAQSIGKRIGRTRNWVVALKSLMLVLRIFQDGDPYFPREIFHAMKRGAKILNLSNFKDDSTPNSWDYTSFIRTFALYLDERLDCFLTGKLQRRFTYYREAIQKKSLKHSNLSNESGIKGMKPTLVLDRITHWQKLLDRAIGSRPTGAAKNNSLIKISLYAILQESFDLYRDISDGLSVIFDNFFQLPYEACAIAYKACVKSSKQFDELSGFYALCASLGIGKTSEYPSVQKVSNELMETLQEFMKDRASFSANNGQPLSPICDSKRNLLPTLPKDTSSVSGQDESNEQFEAPLKFSERGSEYGSQCASLEDLVIFTTDADLSLGKSLPIDQTSSCFDLVIFDDFQQVEKCDSQANDQDQQNRTLSSNHGSIDCWDLVLAEITSTPKQVEQYDSQTRYQEQKITTLSPNNNGSTDCCDLVLAEIASTPKQVEKHDSQTTDQEQKNTTLKSINGSIDCWGLVLAEIASTPKQVKQHDSQTRDQEQQNLDLNNSSKDCWDLVFAKIGTTPEHTSTNKLSNGIGSLILDSLFDQPSSVPQAQYNPFLENTSIVPSSPENYKVGFANFFDLAPTFRGNVTMVSAHNPLEVAIAPTSTGQSYNSQTSLAQTVGDLNGMTPPPTSTPQVTFGTKMVAEPTFHAQSLNTVTEALSTQNVDMALTEPTLAPQNANKNMVSSTFWALDLDDTQSEAPVCCLKNSSETTNTKISTRDEPFEAWIDAITNN
ncbi:clathrin coat assembly protein AP180-like [Prosopis cineraria]|uniref:clathrin coat assembly protein AP180-like n=1 Tax=Prosopis cineraria TaxID=364024 RepID=UPI00241061B3|nr:clathrin coat assembly protein AP180-like [Prosopis cineraria]